MSNQLTTIPRGNIRLQRPLEQPGVGYLPEKTHWGDLFAKAIRNIGFLHASSKK
jgi:hypothetical protein